MASLHRGTTIHHVPEVFGPITYERPIRIVSVDVGN
jgi:hypothetical protein